MVRKQAGLQSVTRTKDPQFGGMSGKQGLYHDGFWGAQSGDLNFSLNKDMLKFLQAKELHVCFGNDQIILVANGKKIFWMEPILVERDFRELHQSLK